MIHWLLSIVNHHSQPQPVQPKSSTIFLPAQSFLSKNIPEKHLNSTNWPTVSSFHLFSLKKPCCFIPLGYNLDPRGVLHASELLRYAFREALRTVLLVDAPVTLATLWAVVKPHLPQGTQGKVWRPLGVSV